MAICFPIEMESRYGLQNHPELTHLSVHSVILKPSVRTSFSFFYFVFLGTNVEKESCLFQYSILY